MEMGYKVELNNIVCMEAGQRYVSAKNKHSYLKWMDSRAILLWISLCLCGGWPRKLWEQLAAFTSRVKGYIHAVSGWLLS